VRSAIIECMQGFVVHYTRDSRVPTRLEDFTYPDIHKIHELNTVLYKYIRRVPSIPTDIWNYPTLYKRSSTASTLFSIPVSVSLSSTVDYCCMGKVGGRGVRMYVDMYLTLCMYSIN
jgi:hypothetical protein